MDRILVAIEGSELDAILSIGADGTLLVDTAVLSRALGRSLGLIGIRVAIENADYLCDDKGLAVSGTETVAGLWWQPHQDDVSLIGSFSLERLSLAVVTDGEGPSPLVGDATILERALTAIASEYAEARAIAPDAFEFEASTGTQQAVVRVTPDHRLRRPQDLLGPEQLREFTDGRLALAIVHMIGGGKALVVKHGM